MLCLKMFNFVSCVIIFCIIFHDVQSRFVFKPDIQRGINQDKVVATWEEAKEQCEIQGAILASPIDAAHLKYMRTYIEVNDHTSPYFIGFKAVIDDGELNYMSVEGILLDELPDETINMIDKIDPENGNCLTMDRHEIRAMSCWEQLPYICYTKVTNATSNVPIGLPNVFTTVNTQSGSFLPEFSSGEQVNVSDELAINVSTVTIIPTHMNTEVTTEVDASIKVTSDVSIETSSNEDGVHYIDVPTEQSTNETVVTIYSNQEGLNISVEAISNKPTTDVSVEASSVVVVEEVTDATPVVPTNPSNISAEAFLIPTTEAAGPIVVTTAVSIQASSIIAVEEVTDATPVPTEPSTSIEPIAVTASHNDLSIEMSNNTAENINIEQNESDDDDGYNFHGIGNLYKVHDSPLSWVNANATCTREGGYLAVITNADEAELLADIGNIYPHVVWIGIKKDNGVWRSVRNHKIEDIFNEWSVVYANYECGVIMSTKVLDDRDCEYPLPFICEKQIGFNAEA